MKSTASLLFLQLFLLVFCQSSVAQRYLPATITFHSGQTESGTVYYGNWVETPQFFLFVNPSGTEQKAGVDKIRSVKVTRKDGKTEYYECRVVAVNRSPTKLADLEIGPAPRMEKDTVFMQTLLLSEVNLYLLKQDGVNHFFVEKDSIQALIFKQYIKDPNDRALLENNRFRQQLIALTIDCPYLRDQILRVSHSEKPIRDVLLEYNKCQRTEVKYQYRPERLKISVYVGGGATIASLQSVEADESLLQPFDMVEKDPTTHFTPMAGFLFPIPRTNARFCIKTDVSMRRIEYSYGYKLPPFGYYTTPEKIDLLHIRSSTLLQWNIVNRKNKLYIQGGILSSWITRDESVLTYGSVGGEYETVQRRHEFGLVGGAGCTFGRIGLDVRYDRGKGYAPSAAVSSSVQTISLFVTCRLF